MFSAQRLQRGVLREPWLPTRRLADVMDIRLSERIVPAPQRSQTGLV